MSTTVGSFRFAMFCLTAGLMLAAVSPASAQGRMEVVEADGTVEWARVVPDLGRLETENRITVRALRGFGRLPESFARLALDLRKQGVDLLAAGPNEIRDLLAKAESGELATDPQLLRDLLIFLENRDYHDWTALEPGAVLEPGEADLIRGQGRVVLRDEAGQIRTVQPSGTVEPLAAAVRESGSDETAPSSPSISAPRNASADPVPDAGLQAPEDALPKLPRIWAGAPGMRLFGLDIPLQQSDMEWSELAAVCPAPEGGQLVVGSVQTPFGLQTWAVRHDAAGMPVWSRTFGGDFDTYVTGVVPLGDRGFLIGGSLDADRPGFFIALDAAGQILWSRTANKDQAEKGNKEWIYALAAEGQSAVAVGQVVDQTNSSHALIMAVPADGSPGWRTEIKEGLLAVQAVADGDGWIVGGQAQDAKAAWTARVDGQGQVVWSRTHDGGAVDALGRTPAGDVLAAGSGSDGAVWLRTLGGDGEVRQDVKLDLTLDGVQVPRSVLGMSVGADGDIWLSGEAVGEDGWLARVAPDGQVRWVRVYGQDDADVLKAVRVASGGAISGGATAVGRSFSPDGMGVCSLWIVNVDDAGQPLAGPVLSEDAQIFAKALNASEATVGLFGSQGSVHLVQDRDGTVRMTLPFVSAEEGVPGFGGRYTDVGQISCQARPVDGVSGRWNMNLEIPERMTVRGDDGSEIGALVAGARVLTCVFDANLATLLALDANLEKLRFEPTGPGGQVALSGLDKDLGLGGNATDVGSASLARLAVNMKLEQDSQGRWAGPLTANVEDWRQVDPAGKTTGQLGKIRVTASSENLDLAVLGAMPARLEELLNTAEAPDPVVLGQLADDYMRGIGTGRGEVLVTDFILAEGDEHVVIKELTATGGMTAPGADSAVRDMTGGYAVRGLDLLVDSTQVALDRASVEMRLDRFTPAAIMRAVFENLSGANSAFAWPDLVTKVLGGLDLKFGLHGLNATVPGQEPVVVGQGNLHFSATDFDTPLVGLALAYDHQGVSGLPDVPTEVMPRAVRFDTGLAKIPLVSLLTALPAMAADPTAVFRILAEHNSTLNINAVNVDAPLGGLRLSGLGRAEALGNTTPLGRIDADIEVRNFQALTTWLGSTMNEGERQAMLAMATMVQLAGVEEKGQDSVLHRYKVEFDSRNRLVVNGKDLSALLGGQGGSGAGAAEGLTETPVETPAPEPVQ